MRDGRLMRMLFDAALTVKETIYGKRVVRRADDYLRQPASKQGRGRQGGRERRWCSGGGLGR